jgi:hypothetical protein
VKGGALRSAIQSVSASRVASRGHGLPQWPGQAGQGACGALAGRLNFSAGCPEGRAVNEAGRGDSALPAGALKRAGRGLDRPHAENRINGLLYYARGAGISRNRVTAAAAMGGIVRARQWSNATALWVPNSSTMAFHGAVG